MSLLRELENLFTDSQVLELTAVATGAVVASETGNRLLKPARITPSRADDNFLYGGIAAIGAVFASTPSKAVRRVGLGMITWGAGKIIWNNTVKPILEASLA